MNGPCESNPKRQPRMWNYTLEVILQGSHEVRYVAGFLIPCQTCETLSVGEY